MTIGAAIGIAAKGIFAAISSLSVGQALAVGAFVGGVAYTLYVKIKAHVKIVKNSKKPQTQTQKVQDDYDKKKKSSSTIDFDVWDQKLDDLDEKDFRETEDMYRKILDEIDEDVQTRNRGKNHRYTKKNKKKDFAAVDRMKERDKRRRMSFGRPARTIDDELEKFYSDVDDIFRTEEQAKYGKFVDDDDRDFEKSARSLA